MKRFIYYLIFFTVLFGATACNKSEVLPLTTPTQETANGSRLGEVKSQNGYLIFKDMEHLVAVQRELRLKTDVEARMWEETLGFISLQTIYEKARDEWDNAQTESARVAVLDNYKGKISLIDNEIIDLKYPQRANITMLLNENGWVKTGDALNIFTNDKQVIIQDGDESKVAKAMTLKQSEPLMGILIIKNQYRDQTQTTTHYSKAKNGSSYPSGTRRFDFEMVTGELLDNSNTVVFRQVFARSRNFSKALIGFAAERTNYTIGTTPSGTIANTFTVNLATGSTQGFAPTPFVTGYEKENVTFFLDDNVLVTGSIGASFFNSMNVFASTPFSASSNIPPYGCKFNF